LAPNDNRRADAKTAPIEDEEVSKELENRFESAASKPGDTKLESWKKLKMAFM